MKLHVMAGILLCSLVNFLNGSEQLKISRKGSAVKIYSRETSQGVFDSVQKKVVVSALVKNLFPQEAVKNLLPQEADSDMESNGTRSNITSPNVTPEPQILGFDLVRTTSAESFSNLATIPSSRSIDSMTGELGSPLTGSRTEHPEKTPVRDHREETPEKDNMNYRHPEKTPSPLPPAK